MQPPDFDLPAAHCYFAAHCFNLTWELMDKPERTLEENERMLWLTHASLWHWTQRTDCSPSNLSIGYWQVSRVYTLLNRAEDALRYANQCVEITPGDDPFLMAYAHEAIARAAILAGDHSTAETHLTEAHTLMPLIDDADDRQALERDLRTMPLR
jgi:Flp pilus assembly protein TadD